MVTLNRINVAEPSAELVLETDKDGLHCLVLKVGGNKRDIAFIDEEGILQLLQIPEDYRNYVSEFVALDNNGYWKTVA